MRRAIVLWLTLTLLLSSLVAQPRTVDGDTLCVSLLTCTPHDEVYSLYGHTALRFRSASGKMDWAVNYGVFDYNTPNFALRFVLGKTDYILGVFPFADFWKEYDGYGSDMHEQVLNLTKTEKERIYTAMYDNAQPMNREYRYNFFYDNCTTRARDLILSNIDGDVCWSVRHNLSSGLHGEKPTTFREWVHLYNGRNAWTRFGCDLLLGVGADREISDDEAQFLPDNLMADFAAATVRDASGDSRQLVASTQTLKAQHPPMHSAGFPVHPRVCCVVLFVLSFICTFAERLLRTWWWWCDLLFIVITGLCGIVLTVMLFSKHPTVSVNLQLLVLNPLPLLFALPAFRRRRNGQPHFMWTAWTVMLVAGLVGSFFQHYAEGMLFVLLACLLRSVSGMIIQKKQATPVVG